MLSPQFAIVLQVLIIWFERLCGKFFALKGPIGRYICDYPIRNSLCAVTDPVNFECSSEAQTRRSAGSDAVSIVFTLLVHSTYLYVQRLCNRRLINTKTPPRSCGRSGLAGRMRTNKWTGG
jgi:hypothetical protein